jgi:hypothetical protein
MKTVRMPSNQKEMDLFLDDVFRVVLGRQRKEFREDQLKLPLGSGKPHFKIVETE